VTFCSEVSNYQIEHHLFPSMPRNHFAAAAALVRPYCAKRGLPYRELVVLAVFRPVWHESPRQGRHGRRSLVVTAERYVTTDGRSRLPARSGPRTRGVWTVDVYRPLRKVTLTNRSLAGIQLGWLEPWTAISDRRRLPTPCRRWLATEFASRKGFVINILCGRPSAVRPG